MAREIALDGAALMLHNIYLQVNDIYILVLSLECHRLGASRLLIT
jgi:hypothetical protein